MSAKILIVEDNQSMSRILQINLEHAGYKVKVAADGPTGLKLYETMKPDLVMLDVALPYMSGLEVCQRIREESNVPILMMSAHAITEEEIAAGLDIGADEYMVKPLGDIELAARIKALLRRASAEANEGKPLITYKDDYLSVDLNTRRVYINNKECRLTPTEFNLLVLFIQNSGEVLSFQQILEQVWGPEYKSEHHYPRIYVSHLRRKVEPDFKNPTYIHNEYGVGYRFVPKTNANRR
ncbi:MAG: response regulator transcription factor [Anaerolineae bacterium]|nr:response regulator transcription factor [Anaerolineae bacterium]